jgi:hypothetical protein
MLSEERIKSFQAVYKKVLGKDITREEAFEKGSDLIRMMQIIYKPMTEKQWDNLQKRIKELDEMEAKENTDNFWKIFEAAPTDRIITTGEIKEILKDKYMSDKEANERIDRFYDLVEYTCKREREKAEKKKF